MAVLAALALGIVIGRVSPAPRARAAQEPAKPATDNPYAKMLHVGILVPDLDAAIAKWQAMGFTDIAVLPPNKGVARMFHGQPLECTLRQAFIRGTSPQIELLQPVEDVPNPWSSVLKERGEVLHHVAYRVPDSLAELEKFRRLGMEEIAQGKWAEGDSHWGTFHYVKDPDGGLIIEFISRIPNAEGVSK
jgi:catechol 2,3-dioxygenase-like lactoylglutathione lyase family enzyme